MGKKEKEKINQILSNLDDNQRLFRINAGMGWTGKIVKHTGDIMIIKNPRAFHGAPAGSPDLIGWQTIEITSQMVGKKIAQFIGIEIKATGKLSKFQKSFKDLILKMGGIFKVIEN